MYAIFLVFEAVLLKNKGFRNFTPFSLVKIYWYFNEKK